MEPTSLQVVLYATKRNASFTAGNSAFLVTANPASSHAFTVHIVVYSPASLYKALFSASSGSRRLHQSFSSVV